MRYSTIAMFYRTRTETWMRS